MALAASWTQIREIIAHARQLGSERLLASARSRPAGRHRLQPGVGRRRARGTSPTAWRRTRRARLARALRPAARVPVRRAGEHDRDRRTAATSVRRVPVYSLYSETREPTRGDAARPRRAGHRPAGRRHPHLHLHLHDGQLPDGARASTASRSIVCDRPNPIGGVDGRRADARCPASSRSSGMYPIPMRHGMTIGELARLFNEHFGIGADLEVVPMEGWRREMYSRRRPDCRG